MTDSNQHTHSWPVVTCDRCDMTIKDRIEELRGEVETLHAENKRIRDEKYEAACLRTGHVATQAKGRIAARLLREEGT